MEGVGVGGGGSGGGGDSGGAFASLMRGALAGAMAGVVADSFAHPVDTARVRLQVQVERKYRGLVHTLVKTVQNEGFFALYRGFGAVIVASAPAHALYFGALEMCRRMMGDHFGLSPTVTSFVSGVAAELGGSVIWQPMDVVKQRMQSQDASSAVRYRNSAEAVAAIVRENGVRSLYRGWLVGLATYGPYCGLYFVFYERFKQVAAGVGWSGPHVHLVSGFCAGSLAAALTNPIDVVKTRIQVQNASDADAYRGVFDGVRRIARGEGLQAFLKGVQARVMWAAPASAITIVAYEQCKVLVSMLF